MAIVAKYVSADTQITTKPCLYFAHKLIANGANDCWLKVYNTGAAASAATSNQVDWGNIDASIEGNGLTKPSIMPEPVKCNDGLYVDINGTNAAAIVYYKARY